MVETNLVPKTRISGNLFLPITKERIEPIAGAIIEAPENEEQAVVLQPALGVRRYVPVGSVKKGEDLVMTGGMRVVHDTIVQGKTTACTHMPRVGFDGRRDVPPIAGRSPSYLVRQLFDMRQGARDEPSAQLIEARRCESDR